MHRCSGVCMKIAIPVSGNRVSTVFDAADELLLIETGPGNAQQRSRSVWVGENAVGRIARIREMEAHILICGAMSAAVERMLEAAGVRVISFVRGTVDEVLDAFHNGKLGEGRFFLPGCAPCEGWEQQRHRQGPGRTGGGGSA